MKRSLRSWIWRVPVRDEVDEELAFHVEMRTRELVERGMSLEEARRAAMSRLGDVDALKRSCVNLGEKRNREMRISQWFDELYQDVRFALRQLRGAPMFAFVAILTLALGIGANSAIFALVDATLLRPLPFPEPDRLAQVQELNPSQRPQGVSQPNLADWNTRTTTFERLAGFVPGVGGVVTPGADGTAENISRQWVRQGIFEVLGVRPIAGRTFSDDDVKARAAMVVLSESFWQARFNRDPGVIGSTIRLDGEPWTIAGVVPADFQLPGGRSSIWALDPRNTSRTSYQLRVFGRVKPGVSIEAAREDLTAVAASLAQDFPDTNQGRSVIVTPLRDILIGSELRLTSQLFLAVVGLVLLICCANVASLLMARATVRARELALRSALGAGRRRVIRQLLTESLVLSVIGGTLGMALGAAILQAAPALLPTGLLPAAVVLKFDVRVVAFCAVTALGVGLVFGVVPAWQATRFSLSQALAADGRTTAGHGGRMRSVLVAAEVAVAVLLLFGGGLLLRTLLAIDNVDRGYRADDALTMMVDPLASSYPTPETLTQFLVAVENEVLAIPGVRSVAWATTLPMGPSDAGRASFEIAGDAPLDESRRPTADFQIVSPAYFQTIDLPIVGGRGFSDRDTRGGPLVCIVNEALVRTYFQGRSPIGMSLALRPAGAAQAKPTLREIVGVARQVKGRPDEAEDLVQVYVPLAQSLRDDLYIVVTPSVGDAAALTPAVRAAIGRIDKAQLVSVRNFMTLDGLARDATARHRFRAILVATFAALALLLAMVGVFGMLAYAVQQRTRDIGVRRALGASTSDVLRLVAGNATGVVLSGAAIGLALSAALSQSISTVLFGVEPLDPATFALVGVVLFVTAVVAVAAPAWRAARIDPVSALRGD